MADRKFTHESAPCAIGGCSFPPVARSLCSAHYAKERKAGRLAAWAGTRPRRVQCACGCGGSPANGKASYIQGHRPVQPAEAAFWRNVNKTDTCWLWTGNMGDHGYGRFWHPVKRANILAHRFSLSLVEPLRGGLQVDHLCRTPLCVNPAHLEQVTGSENVRRQWVVRPRVTHCRQGHAFDADNTITESSGARRCRTCLRAKGRIK